MNSSLCPKINKWFSEQDCDPMQICQIFENIPGVSFFIKDTNHRLLHINKRFLPRLGVATNDELYGKTDFDLFPPRLAEHFRKDDRTVIDTRQPMLNILELVFNSQGLPDWYLTNKYPLLNSDGNVVGVIGTVRPYGEENPVHNQDLKWERDDEIGRAVSYIRGNFRTNLEIANLVEVSGLNHRKLHRGFIELFGVAPMQFITRTRIEAACDDLLTTKKKLSQIAEDNGFYDQSSFTQHFRRQMKVTPLKYRKQKGFA
ncbi:MAG: AraC family transcriptional regulator [Opitutales bacterium]|mgnify:CR=1 FL=1|nr:AraC family transcriptional regulator [Opitutales bacterium]